MKKNIFDPNKAFFSLPLVKWISIFWFGAAGLSTLVIIANSNLKPDFSSDGFNQALEIFKFPLWIITSMIPIIAVFATNHRSEQTKRQIEESKAQNNFRNYFDHKKEFSEYIEELRLSKNIIESWRMNKAFNYAFECENKSQAYDQIFNNASARNGLFQVNKEKIITIIRSYKMLVEELNVTERSENLNTIYIDAYVTHILFAMGLESNLSFKTCADRYEASDRIGYANAIIERIFSFSTINPDDEKYAEYFLSVTQALRVLSLIRNSEEDEERRDMAYRTKVEELIVETKEMIDSLSN